MLNIHDHNRVFDQMRYVYPVLSRRAGGVSIGINLNTNNACNWACVYCQVPDLVRGAPPAVDMLRLESELEKLLQDILFGDFMQQNVSAESRFLRDIAFSGNGEPTSSPDFPEVVQCVLRVMASFSLQGKIKLRLISNGSLMHRLSTQQAIGLLGKADGEVWFKVDRASRDGISLINKVNINPQKLKKSLELCGDLAPTWVQTCCFKYDGAGWTEEECATYLDLLASVKAKIKGVHLYGLARPSMQTEAGKLSAISEEDFSSLARQIAALGLQVSVLI